MMGPRSKISGNKSQKNKRTERGRRVGEGEEQASVSQDSDGTGKKQGETMGRQSQRGP